MLESGFSECGVVAVGSGQRHVLFDEPFMKHHFICSHHHFHSYVYNKLHCIIVITVPLSLLLLSRSFKGHLTQPSSHQYSYHILYYYMYLATCI